MMSIFGQQELVVGDQHASDEQPVASSCTLLKETSSQDFNPTEDELKDYAEYIGIDPEAEADLMHLAREGLTAQVPQNWQAYQNDQGQIFYFNQATGESSWDHPADEIYRKKIVIKRSESLVMKAPSPAVKSFRARLFEVAATPEAKVTVVSAAGGAVALGGTGAVVGTAMGAVAGGAIGVVPALFTLGLSIPVCATVGGGIGFCAGTATGAGTGLVAGGAAGYGAHQYWKTSCGKHELSPSLTDADMKEEAIGA